MREPVELLAGETLVGRKTLEVSLSQAVENLDGDRYTGRSASLYAQVFGYYPFTVSPLQAFRSLQLASTAVIFQVFFTVLARPFVIRTLARFP